ncbi:hypothetical protein K450DRAFT_231915 [Umbelopsis ramanniana AG]|uniref:AMP-dependent synthetase/ligase domain-containing protein n=1 Tax=Umbelopsis ramanniana AG TaxID=1314678 RepID=A0AAD5ECS5_UMBRA|nr:uncharacterized protein K450DRAFT_231915 [Umbelopsis ramanniana AG]KAI8581563.1 hypothetical protein K450DRAFT_231915 [Umbelopsis ramanniana AG]
MIQQLFSVEVGDKVPGETRVRRSILSPDKLVETPAQNVHTLYDVLRYSAHHYTDRNGFGFRKELGTVQEEKEIVKQVNGSEIKETKSWTYYKLSDYQYTTYQEAAKITQIIGSGLKQLGMTKGDKLEIFAMTSFEWMMMAHGAFTQSMTVVTAYDTLGAEGLGFSICEVEAVTCFTNADLIPVLRKVLPTCPSVRNIIYTGELPEAEIQDLKSTFPQLSSFISYNELLHIGESHMSEPNPPQKQELCCIMYTSGSTGTPKGVLLTHANVVAAISGVNRMLQHFIEDGDTVMAYLPLAHVLEFLVENVCIFFGLTLGYGTVKTLTDASVRECRGDFAAFRPSIVTGVPQVWETIKKTVMATVAARGPRIESIFHGAVDLKSWLHDNGYPAGVLDKVVFKKVKQQLGGRFRYALSGGAPLSTETQRFLSLTAAPILGGYGMTESCGMCSVMTPEQFSYGPVGAPVPCTEVKLVDAPEAGYLSTNEPKPQGEIWIRGPSVTAGYFKNETLTRESITSDGWLMTGDIGEWNQNGTLSIIDRRKNLIKLSNGEYIALEKIESIYKSSTLAENICVYADSLCARPVALFVPVEKSLKDICQEKGIGNDNWETLCKDRAVRNLVLNLLHDQGKKSGLKGSELIHDVWICPELWTTDMGYLTAAQKLNRRIITEDFKEQLKEMNQSQKN